MSEQNTEILSQIPVEELAAQIESLLFVAGSSVTINQLAEALDKKAPEIETGLQTLEAIYAQNRGLALQRHGGRVQLSTAPQWSACVEKFLGLEATSRLTRAALEALAIIAYRQPITRPGIDAVRGVNSDGVLKSLLSKGLVQEVGRSEGPGRPILYSVTSEFLQHFGLSSISELPPFELPEAEEPTSLLKD